MTPQELCEKLVEWSSAVLPDLVGGYPFATDESTEGLPHVEAVVINFRRTTQPPANDFPLDQLEQFEAYRLFECGLMLVVPPKPTATASQALNGFAAALEAAIDSDRTLGDRVHRASENFEFSFDPPFVELDDGTKGRQTTMALLVIDPISQ